MFTPAYWRDLAERTVSSAAEAAGAVVALSTFDMLNVSAWSAVGVAAATAGLLTVLKSLAARQTGNPESASLVK